jgi:aminopeptidase N
LSLDSSFVTRSGKEVKIGIYAERDNADKDNADRRIRMSKLEWAMRSLKDAMRWDEEVFGLEYDLDTYNIVAVNNFNMGAMENKGLNIFLASLVVASPDTATDSDYNSIMEVVAHEYFHNWTGNRVTCRDWFQLTLKEGLTVFRDQWFSADKMGASTKRINDVKGLFSTQFPEDQVWIYL